MGWAWGDGPGAGGGIPTDGKFKSSMKVNFIFIEYSNFPISKMEAKTQLCTLVATSTAVRMVKTLVMLHRRAEQTINTEKYDFLYQKLEPISP